ncbi:MAG: MATE family efflux transporter [Oscillibacter sp.]|nr:MATE family efflux transporter [Oscillibacter sp.]
MREHEFTRGAILPALIRFALPVLLALFLQAAYGAVDLQVVGKFGTAADISAVSTGSQVMQSVTMIVVGFAVGVTVLLGQKIGEGKPQEGGGIVGSGIVFFALVTVVLMALLIPFAPQMARILKAPADAFAGTVTYVRICSAGALFIVAYNLLGSVFRGIGDSKIPLLAVAIACAANIAGDLLLVAVFHMGVAGAAIATVMAQALSVLLSFLVIRRRELPFILRREDVRYDAAIVRRIVKIGSPVALQDLLVSISFLVMLAIANAMGTIASAGVGVAEKLCAFVLLVPSAYAQSMTAFVAQNVGAREYGRAKRALLCGIGTSLIVSVGIFLLVFFRGDLLASIFAEDARVISAGAEYLKAYAFDSLLTSVLFCSMGYFNGCGETFFVMVQGLVGAFGVRIPMALVMRRLFPGSLFALGVSTPTSTVVQILLCAWYFFRMERKRDAAGRLEAR